MPKNPLNIPMKDSGFGKSNHPILPDGRTIKVPRPSQTL